MIFLQTNRNPPEQLQQVIFVILPLTPFCCRELGRPSHGHMLSVSLSIFFRPSNFFVTCLSAVCLPTSAYSLSAFLRPPSCVRLPVVASGRPRGGTRIYRAGCGRGRGASGGGDTAASGQGQRAGGIFICAWMYAYIDPPACIALCFHVRACVRVCVAAVSGPASITAFRCTGKEGVVPYVKSVIVVVAIIVTFMEDCICLLAHDSHSCIVTSAA